MKEIPSPYKYISQNFPSSYAIIISIGIIFWISGINELLDYYVYPKRKPWIFFVVAFFGLAILYLNDYKLDELHSSDFPGKVAAVVSSNHDS